MPAQHGLRLDDQEHLLPAPESAGKEDEEAAIGAGEVRTLDGTIEHDELLAEQKVFSNQLRFTASEVSDGTERTAVRNRPGQARDGGADDFEPATDDRLNALQDPEPSLPPSSCFDTLLSYAVGVYGLTRSNVGAL